MSTLRIAVFQRTPLFDAIPGVLARLRADLAWCAHHAVDLALFPECYLQGYASDRATIARRAIDAGSGAMDSLREITAGSGTELVIGFAERRGGVFHNSAAVLRDGILRGVYAKTHPNESGFDAGAAWPVFNLGGRRYGINICNDANFPEAARAIAAQGASLLCYPLNNMLRPAVAEAWRGRSLDNLRARARETGCWVASADVVGVHEGRVAHGCTCIVGPDGKLVARVPEGVEGTAVVDVG